MVAVVAMVLDHFSQIILEQGIILTAPYSMLTDAQFSILLFVSELFHILGRVAFPIFCFLLVEGFLCTRSLKRYFLNLGVFAVLSEPIYDLALTGKLFSLRQQNVLFTLLLGLAVLTVIQHYKGNVIRSSLAVLLGATLSYIFSFDGWYYGIFLISVFYLFRDKPVLKTVLAALVMYICGLDFSIQGLMEPNFLLSVFSLLFINLYNGERGLQSKYFFYWFYPVHLLLLILINTYIIIPIISR